MAERSHFAPHCKWTVFMGCLRRNVFDTVFSKVLPAAAWKTTETFQGSRFRT